MKYLVVYYSWSGKTAKVAEAIAKVLAADIEPIRDAKRRSGFFAYIRSAIEAKQRKAAPVLPWTKSAADYDVVVLGSPVWAGEIASPLRAYIERESSRLKQVAFFCTLGGANGAQALASMRTACGGREPLAELLVDASALASGAWRAQVEEFERKLRTTGAAATAAQC